MTTLEELKEDLQYLNSKIERYWNHCINAESEGKIEEAMRYRKRISDFRKERIEVRALIEKYA